MGNSIYCHFIVHHKNYGGLQVLHYWKNLVTIALEIKAHCLFTQQTFIEQLLCLKDHGTYVLKSSVVVFSWAI